jgi:hypothetical protein
VISALVFSGCMAGEPAGGTPLEDSLVSGVVSFQDSCPALPSGCGASLDGSRWEYGSVCFSIDDFLPVGRDRCPGAFFNPEASFGEVRGSIDFGESAMTRDVEMTLQAEVVYSEECVPNRSRCEESMTQLLENRFGVTPSCNYLPYRTGEMYCVCRLPQTTFEALEESTPMTMGEGLFEVQEAAGGQRYGYCANPGQGLRLSVPSFAGMHVGGLHSLIPVD